MSTSEAREYARGGIPPWTFADKVRKARDLTGLGQKEFAERIDINPSSLAAYEKGRSAPRFRDAPTIAKSIQMLTGIPYEWFLVDDEPTMPTMPTGPNVPQKDYKAAGSIPAVAYLSDYRAS